MKIRKYQPGIINEFDSLEDLRAFDKSYIDDTRSVVIKQICKQLKCKQKDIYGAGKVTTSKDKFAFQFSFSGSKYIFTSNDLTNNFKIRLI